MQSSQAKTRGARKLIGIYKEFFKPLCQLNEIFMRLTFTLLHLKGLQGLHGCAFNMCQPQGNQSSGLKTPNRKLLLKMRSLNNIIYRKETEASSTQSIQSVPGDKHSHHSMYWDTSGRQRARDMTWDRACGFMTLCFHQSQYSFNRLLFKGSWTSMRRSFSKTFFSLCTHMAFISMRTFQIGLCYDSLRDYFRYCYCFEARQEGEGGFRGEGGQKKQKK